MLLLRKYHNLFLSGSELHLPLVRLFFQSPDCLDDILAAIQYRPVLCSKVITIQPSLPSFLIRACRCFSAPLRVAKLVMKGGDSLQAVT